VEKHSDIVSELQKGETIRRMAKLTEKSKSTVQWGKKALDRLETTG